ncbi:MAG: LysM peptidoglycan-binding domain-containing protein [Anaerolineae bacterium]|nr:LysM peptidoglycan-binding domain-containing protein [Anaerolineae bacterium]
MRYGVTMSSILNANPGITNMNVISEGQVITIPGPPTTTPAGTTSTTTTTDQSGQGGGVGQVELQQTQQALQQTQQAIQQLQQQLFTPTPLGQ